jgi:hypothetical protein
MPARRSCETVSRVGAWLIALALPGSIYALPPEYEITDLGAYVYPIDINNSGTVVGARTQGTAISGSGFVWSEQTGFTAIPVLPGDTYAYPTAINNPGYVVGTSVNPTDPAVDIGTARPFIWSQANGTQKLPQLTPDPGARTTANDINDHNQFVADTSFRIPGGSPGVVVKGYYGNPGGGVTPLETTPDPNANQLPSRINNLGDVTGLQCFVRCNLAFPYGIVSGGVLRTNINNDPGLLPIQPATVPPPLQLDVNDAGLAVGLQHDNTRGTPFPIAIDRQGRVIDLGVLLDGIPQPEQSLVDGVAFGVNNNGEILGIAHVDGPGVGSRTFAFVTDGETVIDLSSFALEAEGWLLGPFGVTHIDVVDFPTSAHGLEINDRGDIVLIGVKDGIPHGLLLRAVPEPQTFLLLGIGLLACVSAIARRRAHATV